MSHFTFSSTQNKARKKKDEPSYRLFTSAFFLWAGEVGKLKACSAQPSMEQEPVSDVSLPFRANTQSLEIRHSRSTLNKCPPYYWLQGCGLHDSAIPQQGVHTYKHTPSIACSYLYELLNAGLDDRKGAVTRFLEIGGVRDMVHLIMLSYTWSKYSQLIPPAPVMESRQGNQWSSTSQQIA